MERSLLHGHVPRSVAMLHRRDPNLRAAPLAGVFRRVTATLGWLGLTSALGACDDAKSSTPITAFAQSPAIVLNPDPGTFVLYSNNSIYLRDRVHVTGGNV